MASILRSYMTPRNLYAFAVGTVAGTVVGTVGFGGAQIVIPCMTLPWTRVANYSQLAATGMSLSSLSISTVSTGYQFWRERKVHVLTAAAIGLPAMLSARFGTLVAKRMSSDALALFFNGFSIVLMPTHYYIQYRRDHTKKEAMGSDTAQRGQAAEFLFQHACYGMCSGILSALMGVGGLPITMSYLTVATDLPHHFVQGTAVCSLVPAIAVSAASRWKAVPPQPALGVAVGAIIGAYAGAHVALQLSEHELRHLYMGSLILFGSRSVLGAARNISNLLKARKSW